MKTSLIIVVFLGLVVSLTSATSSSSITDDNHREKRAIGEWFSDFFKKFQKKGRRRPMVYQSPPPSMYSSSSFQQPYGTPPMSQYGSSYEPHNPSYLHITLNQPTGYGGDQSSGYGGGQEIHSTGYSSGNGGSQGHGQSNGYSGGNVPQGFGPIKSSDIIDFSNGNSYQPIHQGASVVIAQEPIYHAIQEDFHDTGFDVAAHGEGGQSLQFIQDSYSAPSRPIVQNAYVPPVPSQGYSNGGLSFASPSNDIFNSGNQYQQPIHLPQLPLANQQGKVLNGPLASYSSSFENVGLLHPSGLAQLLSGGHQSGYNVIFNANTGLQVQDPSELGAYDPIIEIIFKDGEPAPLPPIPEIDPSYFEPVKDDVEVYFIEYSPEDEIDDFNNIDLSGAQPAILQNLPNELPSDLRAHLIKSGILENAEIEIVDLEHAINDQSIDLATRNALQAAYNRPNRDIRFNFINNQTADIRVQRLSYDSDTPEGIAEVLTGLRKYRKGTFAGVVEINDKGTDKYIPVTIDGGRLPLPHQSFLDNKKVEGVLVLAPDARDKRSKVWPQTYIHRGIRLETPSSISSRTYVPPRKQKRRVDISWADIDSNGWVPIVNS